MGRKRFGLGDVALAGSLDRDARHLCSLVLEFSCGRTGWFYSIFISLWVFIIRVTSFACNSANWDVA